MTKVSLQSILDLVQQQTTNIKICNKLYWNEYPYRIEFNTEVPGTRVSSMFGRALKERFDAKVRVEWKWVQCYVSDLSLLKEIIDYMAEHKHVRIRSFNYINSLKSIDELKHTIICDKYPYNTYEYKVMLSTKRQPRDDCERFVKWIQKYKKEGKEPYKMVQGSLDNLKRYSSFYGGYIYVQDAKHLHLLSFRASNFIQSIKHYEVKNAPGTST